VVNPVSRSSDGYGGIVYRSAPVVLTGSQRPDDEDDAAMLGTIYFLHKPVTQQDLTAAVEVLRLVVTTGAVSAASTASA